MTSVAVLGTGLLGTAIATRLLDQGLNVHVWNRDSSRIAPLAAMGANVIHEEIWGANRRLRKRAGQQQSSLAHTLAKIQLSPTTPSHDTDLAQSTRRHSSPVSRL